MQSFLEFNQQISDHDSHCYFSGTDIQDGEEGMEGTPKVACGTPSSGAEPLQKVLSYTLANLYQLLFIVRTVNEDAVQLSGTITDSSSLKLV